MKAVVTLALLFLFANAETVTIPIKKCLDTASEIREEAEKIAAENITIEAKVKKQEGKVSTFREETLQTKLTFIGHKSIDKCNHEAYFYKEEIRPEYFKDKRVYTNADTTVLEEFREKNMITPGQMHIKEFNQKKLLEMVRENARVSFKVTKVDDTLVKFRIDVKIPPEIVREWMLSYAQTSSSCEEISWTLYESSMSQDAYNQHDLSIDVIEEMTLSDLGYKCKQKGFPRLTMQFQVGDGETTGERNKRETIEWLKSDPDRLESLKYSLSSKEGFKVNDDYVFNVYLEQMYPSDVIAASAENGTIPMKAHPISFRYGVSEYSIEFYVRPDNMSAYDPRLVVEWLVERHSIQ